MSSSIDDPAVQRALALTPASSASARTVDITTIGRRSGRSLVELEWICPLP